MSVSPLSAYTTIRTEGPLLPADILARIASGDTSLGGLAPASYHLDPTEKIGEATNRAWNRLQARWVAFQDERVKLNPTDTGTTTTRERWLLPLFEELKFGRLQTAKKVEVDGKSYAVSHSWQHVPIHLVGCQVDLDHRTVIAGTQRSSPHSLLQELLNRSSGHLWGIVSNGLRLRLLRDNISLTRQAYVEFDLEAMMAGEAYPDFVVLWLLLHQSRFEGERPDLCQLEKWSQAARTEGVRVLDGLRDGVQKAIEHLGQGFLAHSANVALRDNLRSGALDKQDYYRQLLRLVYRLLFLFVAEDRDLLLVPAAEPAAQKRYREYYATTRLRRLATLRAGSRHHDLYCGLKLVMDELSGNGCPKLALPALGSFLFSTRALPDLNACEIANLHLLEAIRSLAVTYTGQSRRVVDYKNLGAEELGSVYESLLELHPELNADAASFELKVAAGSERKKTGSYYTPTSLISCLLDSALDPVLNEAAEQPEAEAAILRLKVVDPACGSGHFLIAAAHRIAKRLAAIRTGEEEPPPEAQRKALRDVIGHCIYGVDVNPMAVELCKVSLWMEALEPGKPLSFLEHRIQCGNSLLGATPTLLAQGIPDEAFTAIEGDDKEICKEFKRINRDERNKQMRLFAATTEPWQQLGNFAASLMNLDTVGDDSIEAIREKERMYEEAIRSGDYLDGRFWSDTWCAAFVWKKTREFGYPITEEVFRRIERNPHACEPWMRAEIEHLVGAYRFFHWHLAFPDIFRIPSPGIKPENAGTGWNGGFDVVLGNPPWERVKLQEKEWFAATRPDIANLSNATHRQRAIAQLKSDDPHLYNAFLNAARRAAGENHLAVNSGRFTLCIQGDTNTYSLFAEVGLQLRQPNGFVGFILPSGIAADHTNRAYFQAIVDGRMLRSVYDFENRERELFPEVYYRMRFCLLTIGPQVDEAEPYAPDFVFFAQRVSDLANSDLHFTLTPADIRILNPETRTCPIFRTRREAEIIKGIYQTVPTLGEASDPAHWHLVIRQGLFHQTNDADLLYDREKAEEAQATLEEHYLIPVYEGRMIGMYDHRASSVAFSKNTFRSGALLEISDAERGDASVTASSRFWASRTDTEHRIPQGYKYQWFLAFKDVTSATNERTLIATFIPRTAVLYTIRVVFPMNVGASLACCLLADWNSICTDYVCRSSTSGNHVSEYIIRQVPVHGPLQYSQACRWFSGDTLEHWIATRVTELVYTAWDLEPLGRDLGCEGPPFRWDAERRFILQCELDAAYFHLYRLDRNSAEYALNAFRIVRERDEAQFAEYRTKRVILEIYDAMAEAERTGVSYQTRLDPEPADPSCRHPRKNVGILAFGSLIGDPGRELASALAMRIKTQTPFPVEYGRISQTRGGAPTLVPHPKGAPVSAQILVLNDDVPVSDARDMLWRREVRREGTGEKYSQSASANAVLIQETSESPWVCTALYTDFNDTGKIEQPTLAELARHAIQSVGKAAAGKDGISYLQNAIAYGIKTPLTDAYRDEILKQTNTASLQEAIDRARMSRVSK